MAGIWFADRGKARIGTTLDDNHIELRVRRWKTRPARLIFRVRNADEARSHFERMKGRLDEARWDYRVTLTPKAKRIRALEIEFDPGDPLTSVAVVNLADRLLTPSAEAADWYRLSGHADLRSDLQDPPVPLFIPKPRVDAESTGYRAGFAAGQALKWILRR